MLGFQVKKAFPSLLLAAALAIAQHGAFLHVLSHVEREIALATQGNDKSPPAGHACRECVAFHGLGHILGKHSAAVWTAASVVRPALAAQTSVLLAFVRIAFDSRAPPGLS